jgi:biopolymer transport protein ExbD
VLLHRSRIAVLARHRARIEIIPLIDVIFFLLATFVLFTLALNRIQSLPVVLPHSGGKDENPDLVTIQVSDSGTIYWNREPIEPTEVPTRLAHYKARTDSPRVVVTGDEKAKFGPLIAVLDHVRQAGITAFSVETRPRPTGK